MGISMEGIRLGREELKRRFGLSERVAVRILALRTQGLGVTPALVEEVTRRPPVLEFLLSPDLLRLAPELKPETFREAFPSAPGLALIQGPEGRLLALEEEILLEEESPAGAGSMALREDAGRTGLFRLSRAELEQIRKILLTSADSKAKIEAIRRLAYSEAPTNEKGTLFLHAVMDSDVEVRQEALGALESVGLDPGTAEALRLLEDGTPRQKRLALERVSRRLSEGSAGERVLIRGILFSRLRHESGPEILAEVLRRMEPMAEELGADPGVLESLCRNLLVSLSEHYHKLRRPAARLFSAVAPAVQEAGAEAVWKLAEGTEDRRLRALLVGLLSRAGLSEELQKRIAADVARVLSRSFGEEIESREFLEVGRLLGDVQVRACLDVLNEVETAYLPNFVRSLEFMADSDSVSDDAFREVAEAFLGLLRTQGRRVRTTILNGALCFSPRVPPSLREKFAEDFISNLHLYSMDRQRQAVESAILRIGPGAWPALRRAASRSPYGIERAAALKLIADIHAQHGSNTVELLSFLEKLRKDPAVPREPLVLAQARIAAHPTAGAARARKLFRELRERWREGKEGFAVIPALAYLASSPAVSAAEISDLLLELMGSLEGRLPDVRLDRIQTEDGPRLSFSREMVMYTEFVPNVVQAIRRLYACDKIAPGIRVRIIGRLIKRWDDLVSFREVWAPGNLVDVAEALSEIARHPETPAAERNRIAGALVEHARNTTFARISADTLVFFDETAEAYVGIVERFVRTLLDMFSHPDFAQQDDRWMILVCLGRVARHARLARVKRQGEAIRERIVELLLEESGPGFHEGTRLLGALAESRHVPAALRKRLREMEKS